LETFVVISAKGQNSEIAGRHPDNYPRRWIGSLILPEIPQQSHPRSSTLNATPSNATIFGRTF
jgi:hypothetical protein